MRCGHWVGAGRRVMHVHQACRISRINLQSQECTRLYFTSQCEEETGASFCKSETQHGRIIDIKESNLVLKGNGVMGPYRGYFAANVLIAGTTKGVTAAAALKGCVMRMNRVWEC